MIRQLFEVQLALGAVPIELVQIPTSTRDELPPTLAALQWVFTTPQVSNEVFRLLEDQLLRNDRSKGRPGMDLWQILVLGVVRLASGLKLRSPAPCGQLRFTGSPTPGPACL